MKSAWLILSALIAGMLLGIGVELVSPAAGTASLPWIEPVGLLWLNALKMTIVPLIVALLITGITATADAARAGTLAFRAVMTFLGAIFLSGLMSLLMTPLLLRLFLLRWLRPWQRRQHRRGVLPSRWVYPRPRRGMSRGSAQPSVRRPRALRR